MTLSKFCILLFGISIVLSSCKNSEKSEKKKEFEMYQPSELALLMEEIYILNDSLKSQIIRGELPVYFPNEILNIHTAEMTNTFSRDENFKKYAAIFLENQQAIYSSSIENVKSNFNNTINTCIACHQTSCTGPIPRIKKLLID